jgi:predicted CopG family antitoxin
VDLVAGFQGLANPLRLSLNTHTYTELIMATKTISITEEAYERLKSLKKNDKVSFSDVILAHYPKKKKLSEVLKEIGANPELADSIEQVSREMRRSSLRRVEF